MDDDEYRKMAEVEDAMWYYRALHQHAMDRLPPPAREPLKVLDAGCGTGGFLRRVTAARTDVRATGLDLSPLACAWARLRVTGDVVEGSVECMPFADAQFDAVTSLDVLYHLDHPEAALAEMLRVLRPGGRLIVNVPAYRWLWSYHDEAVHGRRRYTRGGLTRDLAGAGFLVDGATYWDSIPFPLIVLKRKVFARSSDTSDVRLFPRPVEAAFNFAMGAERAWIAFAGGIPFGCSVLAMARKPDAIG